MERCRPLDLVSCAAASRPLIRFFALAFAVTCAFAGACGQSVPADPISTAKQLSEEQRWQELVRLVEAVPARSAELDYYYGIALAQLGRLAEARQALLAGRRAKPGDKRFLLELAGVEFKQKDYVAAAQWLHRALHLDPADAYANDFLGSIYFLQGNLEAALKYWNRVSRPVIADVRLEPEPRADPVLLDRAFAFVPASILRLPDLLTSRARLRGLEIFPAYSFDLNARDDGKFDVIFRGQELNGFGPNKWAGLLSFFRGIFQQTVYPEYFDLRDENWDVRTSFTDNAALLAALKLRKQGVSASIAEFVSGRWNWSTAVEVSHRDFTDVTLGTLSPTLLSPGYQLKQLTSATYELWRVPERRFSLSSAAASELARIWSEPGHAFAKLQASVAANWLPQARGNDYETELRLRAGDTFGDSPFDEMFMLGIERDNDLWLRAHVGTHDGRKGSAPLGRSYALANWEISKNVYRKTVFNFRLGPFLDTGKILDSSSGTRNKWLWDTGAQAQVNALGFGVVFVYGKD